MHADGLPTEYAEVAWKRGLKGMIVTCHNPMPDGFSSHVRMRDDQFDEYVSIIDEARKDWLGRVDVRMGIEADFFEGYEAFLEKQLNSAPFHFVLGSVHPQLAEYRKQYPTDDPVEYQRNYFHLLATAAETKLFDSISHPDLVKNVTPHDWNPEVIMDSIHGALDRIAATGTAMELNTSGVQKVISEMNPFPEMLKAMAERGIPVTLGADAHQPDRVGDGYLAALELLADCGYNEVTLFLQRKPNPISIAAAKESLQNAELSSNESP
ncbi:Histidinol-phosphatase [Planctomycetes bacterium CA13]|uniref:Histidinol-phosphatase n=2 Tax=Novipirellula herctigrandis TaxID=2527986 RepID=A0A5C5Z2X6_9BACT|nr:Histidinol-phosphatase [Planctomycetes bacterium CA13]